MARSGGTSRTDHTAGKYLILIGKGFTAIGSNSLRLELADTTDRPPRPGEWLQLEGKMYKISMVSKPADDGSVDVTIDHPLEVEGATPPELQPGGSGETWVMLLCSSGGYNLDMQVLLRTMGAHEKVMQLLRLPVSALPLPEELRTRAVLRAVYRVLKALVSGFPQMQNDLVPSIPKMVEHVEKDLIAHDVTPTGCITAVLRDNRSACALMPLSAIRKFVQLAAKKQAPRFLRFLGEICRPAGVAIKRNCQLVAQALSEKEEALLLFDDPAGLEERERLIAENDHINNPRGKLMYHIELIGLLGTLVTGIDNPNIEQMVRETLPLDEVVSHLLLTDLPTPLRANYLRLLDEAYLVTAKPLINDLATDDFVELLVSLEARIAAFVARVDAADDVDLEDGETQEAQEAEAEASFLLDDVLPMITHFFAPHASLGETGVGGLAAAVISQLAGYDDAREEPLVDICKVLGETVSAFRELRCSFLADNAPAVDCLRALAAASFATLSKTDAKKAEAGGLATLALTSLDVNDGDEEPAHPQAELHRFAAAFEKTAKPEAEFRALVAVFSEGLDAAHEYEQRRAKSRRNTTEKPPARSYYARNLVEQLLGAAVVPGRSLDRGLTVA